MWVLAAITSNIGWLLVGDYKIKAWRDVGLPHPSIVTGIVRTINRKWSLRRWECWPLRNCGGPSDSVKARRLVETDEYVVSVASSWEVVIKTQKGLLSVSDLGTW